MCYGKRQRVKVLRKIFFEGIADVVDKGEGLVLFQYAQKDLLPKYEEDMDTKSL